MSSQAHLGGSDLHGPDPWTWLPDIWERIIREYDVKSVLDIGCGVGWTTAWFQKRVPRVLGIEGDPEALVRRRCDPIIAHDYTRGPWLPIDTYDLCWCSEFVEHVEARFAQNWLATMQRARFVCLTYGVPGQGGHHHVNEQPKEYWVGLMKDAGFGHVEAETARFVASTRGGEHHGRNQMCFFENRFFDHPNLPKILADFRAYYAAR